MDGLAQKEGRWYQYRTWRCISVDAKLHAQMQIWELLQQLMHTLVFVLVVVVVVVCGQIHGEKERRHRAGGLSICSEVFWKLPKNNKLSVLEVVKLGKSYNWLVHQLLAIYVIYKHVYISHITCHCKWYTLYNMYSTSHMQQSSITQFLSQMAWRTIFHFR